MQTDAGADRFSTLDGIRAVAAIAVVILHIPHLMGGWRLANDVLAVDLFFILSGFVLGRTYERRFDQGMRPAEFMRLRVIRLFPFYILGIALGTLVALLALCFGGGALTVPWTWTLLVVSLPLSAVMLPTPPMASGDAQLYPLDPVLWSILFELLANFAYVAMWRFLRNTRVLGATVAIFALLLILFGVTDGSVHAGFSWSTAAGGLVRVGFSFFAGVLVARRFKGERQLSNTVPMFLLAGVVALLAFDGGLVYQLACVLLLFPALIRIAVQFEPAPRLRAHFETFGGASYAIYALHKPLYQIALGGMLKFLPFSPALLAPWAGLAYIAALVLLCVVLNRRFDVPVRRWISELRLRMLQVQY